MSAAPDQQRGRLRVATLNTRTLTGRLAAVLQLGLTSMADVFCLQETRLVEESICATRTAARSTGWEFHMGPQGQDPQGTRVGGLAFFTKWPAQLVDLPEAITAGNRVAALKVHRPRQRPMMVVNVYIHANDREAGTTLIEALFEYLAGLGEDYVVLGDYNREMGEHPVSTMLAAGLVYPLYEGPIPAEPRGTHRGLKGYTGRYIDFGLGSPAVLGRARGQLLGPADHDLVYYDIDVACRDQPWRWAPRAPLQTQRVQWDEQWRAAAPAFRAAVAQHDAAAAWGVLSDAAEAALTDPGEEGKGARASNRRGAKRAATARPQQRDPHSAKAPAFQTLLERRLRRLVRRVEELQKPGNHTELETKTTASIKELASVLPSLHEYPGHGQAGCAFLQELAQGEADRASRARIAKWREDLQLDLARMARWVAGPGPESTTPIHAFGDDPDPTAMATAAAASWGDMWNRASKPDASELEALLQGLTPPSACTVRLQVTAMALQKRAGAARRKAAGLDDWTAEQWSALPLDFFQAMADVWNLVLGGAAMPPAWAQVRIALIPKEGGDWRPLAIATLAWRLGVSELIHQTSAWVESWMPDELFGGIGGRGIDQIHERLAEELASAKYGDQPLAGYKADIRKCFDGVAPDIALMALHWVGAPSELVQVLTDFYSRQQRWLSVRGSFAPGAVPHKASILQGCPASPLLLNTCMAVWLWTLRHRGQLSTSVAVYLDDRTVWARGPAAAQDVVAFATAVEPVDAALGFKTHQGKLESFATTPRLRSELGRSETKVGRPKDTFKLLGLQYAMGKTRACYPDQELLKVTKARCKRIRLAGAALAHRAMLVSLLVISTFSWLAPWVHFRKATVQKWAGQVEMAIWGGTSAPGRSAAVFWSGLARIWRHPEVAVCKAALLREWKRPAAGRVAPRTSQAFQDIGWTMAGETWTTHRGTIDKGTVSTTFLEHLIHDAWQRHLWRRDTKTSAQLQDDVSPCFEAGRKLARRDYYWRKVVIGAAADGRTLKRLGQQIPCRCGEPEPTRHHLTFQCPAAPWLDSMRTAEERRTLTPLIPAPVPTIEAEDEEVGVRLLAQALSSIEDDVVYVASDGSCVAKAGSELVQKAFWGVAVHGGPHFGGQVATLEQTPAAAERAGLAVVFKAAQRAGKRVRLFVDNRAACLRVWRGQQRNDWSGDLRAYWAGIALCEKGVEVAWIPSHGKKADWTSPEGWIVEEEARKLNDRADLAANHAARAWRPMFQRLCEDRQQGIAWADRVILKQHATTKGYQAVLRQAVRNVGG